MANHLLPRESLLSVADAVPTSGPHLRFATGAPGTGKTVLLALVAGRLVAAGVAASSVLVVAPSRRQVDILRAALSAHCPAAVAATTAHALALRIVRPARSSFPLSGDLLVVPESERAGFVPHDPEADLLLGGRDERMRRLGVARRDGVPAAEAGDLGPTIEAYEARLLAAGRTDASGMAAFAVAAMAAPGAMGDVAAVLVDSWHELGPVQRRMVLALRDGARILVACGQSDGGVPGDAVRCRLPTDLRSPGIVGSALARAFPGRVADPARDVEGSLVVRTYLDASIEASAVVGALTRRAAAGAPAGSMMVVPLLGSAMARICAAALAAKVAVRVSGFPNPWEGERARLAALFLSAVYGQPAVTASGARAEAVVQEARSFRVGCGGVLEAAAIRAACAAALGDAADAADPGVPCIVDCLFAAAVGDRFAARLSALSGLWKAREGVLVGSADAVAGDEADHVFVAGLDRPSWSDPRDDPDASVALTRSRSHLGLTSCVSRDGDRRPHASLVAMYASPRAREVGGSLRPDGRTPMVPLQSEAERSSATSFLDRERPGASRLAAWG